MKDVDARWDLPDRMRWLAGEELFGQPVWVAAIDLPDVLVLSDGSHAGALTRGYLDDVAKPIVVCLSHGPSFNRTERLSEVARVQILLHGKDRDNRWLGRGSRHCTFWEGDQHAIAPGIKAVHSGGHSAGHALLHVAFGGGVLFLGDLVSVSRSGTVHWEAAVQDALRDPHYARYLRDQITACSFETAVSLHSGPIADARNLLLGMLETDRDD